VEPKEATMTANQFREAMTRHPFEPFQLVLVDGRRLTIDHPEWAAIAPSGREVHFYEPDDTHHWIDARLIVELIAPPQQNPTTAKP
jgi:hypothetical protein